MIGTPRGVLVLFIGLKTKVMLNEKENVSAKAEAETGPFFTTEEKAQFEVFRNGKLSRETIEKWVRNDLTAVMSFIHGTLKDESIFKALVDAYYYRYQRLHENSKLNDES